MPGANSFSIPFMTAGGGFAIGLFSTFDIPALVESSQHALAMTMFGFVTCIVLVIAMTTLKLQTLPRTDKPDFPLGVWVVGTMALFMLALGMIGAIMFIADYWDHTEFPTTAYYSLSDGTSSEKAPVLIVAGNRNDLNLFDREKAVTVTRGAILEVRIPLKNLMKQWNETSSELARNAPPQP